MWRPQLRKEGMGKRHWLNICVCGTLSRLLSSHALGQSECGMWWLNSLDSDVAPCSHLPYSPAPPSSCPTTCLAATPMTTNSMHTWKPQSGPASLVVRGSSSGKWQGRWAGAGVKGEYKPWQCNVSLRVKQPNTVFTLSIIWPIFLLSILFLFCL